MLRELLAQREELIQQQQALLAEQKVVIQQRSGIPSPTAIAALATLPSHSVFPPVRGTEPLYKPFVKGTLRREPMMKHLSKQHPPFSSGWFSWGLGQYRPCNATYCRVSYESLPPISPPMLQGTLHWLLPLDRDIQREQQEHFPSLTWGFSADHWRSIMASSLELSFSFPDTFRQLMDSPALMQRIPSCTNCYFELSKKLVPCPGSEEGFILRFLNAAQGQIAWYLYLTPQGEHCVLVGYPLLDLLNDPADPEYRDQGITEEERSMVLEGNGVYICASSFEEFLYRFWIENILWYKLVWYKGQKPLTEEEKDYLSHYQSIPDQT